MGPGMYLILEASGTVTSTGCTMTETLIAALPSGCNATTYSGYAVPVMVSGTNTILTKTGSISNGVLGYTLPASCSNTLMSYGVEASSPTCNTGYTWNGSACTDAIPPTIASVTSASPSCNTIRMTVNGATDTGGLNATPYSFDGGSTWQAANYKDYSNTSYTVPANQIKVRDLSGNAYTYASAASGTASSCIVMVDVSGNGNIIIPAGSTTMSLYGNG